MSESVQSKSSNTLKPQSQLDSGKDCVRWGELGAAAVCDAAFCKYVKRQTIVEGENVILERLAQDHIFDHTVHLLRIYDILDPFALLNRFLH